MATYNPAYDYSGGISLIQPASQELPTHGSFVNGWYYFMAPSADGGWNFYKSATTNGQNDVQSISQADYFREGGQDMSNYWNGVSGGTSQVQSGPTAAERAAAKAEHLANLRELERKRVEGETQFKQQRDEIVKSLADLESSKEEGLASNASYFNGISPDAMQSQMGNYNMKVLDAYQQGKNTADNNTALVNQAQTLWNQRMAENLAGENTFNEATADYSGGYKYNAGLAPTAATLVAYNAGLPSQNAARMGVSQWAPNYGGMSTQQAAKEKDPLSKYINA